MKARKPKKELDSYVRYSNIAFQMAAIIGIGVFSGVKLDGLLAWKTPVFTLVFSILSVAAAIYVAVRDFLKKP